MSLAETLQREIDAWKTLGVEQPGPSLKAVVLEHGRAYELDREASAAEGKGELGNCFGNATLAAWDNDDLTYVEGFAHSGWGFICHHAWVVNTEGKALELTWRDGGKECGYCIDGERELDTDEPGYDEDEPDTWTEPCPHCKGTGEADEEWRALEGAEYYGIEIDKQTLIKIARRRGLYGALNTQQDLDEILAARKS